MQYLLFQQTQLNIVETGQFLEAAGGGQADFGAQHLGADPIDVLPCDAINQVDKVLRPLPVALGQHLPEQKPSFFLVRQAEPLRLTIVLNETVFLCPPMSFSAIAKSGLIYILDSQKIMKR